MSDIVYNSYYTNIPQKSFDAYVGRNVGVHTLLCALMVEPEAAEDAWEDFQLALPHSLEDFERKGHLAVWQMKQTLSQLAMAYPLSPGANEMLYWLAHWDLRFAVWCDLHVARHAARYGRQVKRSIMGSLDEIERWVRTGEKVTAAAIWPMNSYVMGLNDLIGATRYDQKRLMRRSLAGQEMSDSAWRFARHISGSKNKPDAESVVKSFLPVIAEACMSFPA